MVIKGIAYGLPSRKVGNEELIRELVARNRSRLSANELSGLEERMASYFKLSGTESRYHRADGERAIDITTRTCEDLLRKTGVGRQEIDLLIYTGVGRAWLEPAMANLFVSQLGLKHATCFDILDACASWIRGLLVAKSFLDGGTYRNIVIINSEFNFREYADFEINRPEELERKFSAFTIGEAATAILLSASPDDRDFYFTFRTWGDKHDLCKIPLPNHAQYMCDGEGEPYAPLRFYAESKQLMFFSVKMLIEHFHSDPTLAVFSPDVIFGHAPSESSTTAWLERAHFSETVAFRTHARFGNTVSASVPLGMAVAEEEGRLRRGMKTLLVVGSAGVSTAYAAFTY